MGTYNYYALFCAQGTQRVVDVLTKYDSDPVVFNDTKMYVFAVLDEDVLMIKLECPRADLYRAPKDYASNVFVPEVYRAISIKQRMIARAQAI